MQHNPKLSVTNLSKSFKDSHLKVLDTISLTVHKGELVSVIGPSGCGKSTLLDCIAGLTDPDEGEITSEERPAYMFQDDVMFPWRTVLDNVLLPLEVAGVDKKSARNEAGKFLKEFGLEKFASYYPFQLSGGMRERASLLRTYLCKKDVILLDEPFNKLDALTRQQMHQWFLEIIDKKRKSMLFVTHDVDEAIYLSDRIYILSSRPGKILAEVSVTLSKPRSQNIITSPEFTAYKKKIMDVLLFAII
jgi:ABC-type nitrate/sulfonate/bicarbonate transport system ATPase subunit